MSKPKNAAAERFKKLAKMEEDYAVKLGADVRGYGNEVFREILDSVAIDSRKHAGLYKACAAVAEGHSLSVTDTEYQAILKSVKDHIAVEDKMLKTVAKELKDSKDPRVKMMLEHIRDDEYRHHQLLKAMGELVVKAEVVLEKEVWNQLFKDAFTHGAPEGYWE